MNDVEYIAGREEHVQSLINRDGYILECTKVRNEWVPVFYKTKDGYFEVLTFDAYGRITSIETSDGWESWTYYDNGLMKTHQYSNGVIEYLSIKNDNVYFHNNIGFKAKLSLKVDTTSRIDPNTIVTDRFIKLFLVNPMNYISINGIPSSEIINTLHKAGGYNFHDKIESMEFVKKYNVNIYCGLDLRLPKSVLISKLYSRDGLTVKERLKRFDNLENTWVIKTKPEKYCDGGDYTDFYEYKLKIAPNGAKIGIKHFLIYRYDVISEKTGNILNRVRSLTDKLYHRTVELDIYGNCINDTTNHNPKYLPVIYDNRFEYIDRIVKFSRSVFDNIIYDGFAYNEFDNIDLDLDNFDYDEIKDIDGTYIKSTSALREVLDICQSFGVKPRLLV